MGRAITDAVLANMIITAAVKGAAALAPLLRTCGKQAGAPGHATTHSGTRQQR